MVICLATRWQSGLHHPVSVYAKQVTQGRLRDQCCKYEILACQRHLDDLKRQGTEDFPYVFDTTRADRIIRWFGQCIQIRGVDAGKPIQLEPWQIFDLGCTYGWVHKDTGARRFTHTYNKRARGNYKSSEKSCQGLHHMCGDAIYPPYHPELAKFELEPEVECAAVDRGQAMRVLGDAKKIALASPNIAKRLLIPRSNPIVHRTRGGFMRALSKDTKNKDSGAPTYFVVDEYHAHPNSEIYDLGTNSFGKRAQSLLDVITTAGDDAGSKPCYEEELYAKRVLEDPSVVDESYFVMIRELDEGDDPHNEAAWAKPNPCLRFPSRYSEILLKQIRDEHNAAYASNAPGKIRKFLTRRMCLWQVGSVNHYLDEHCMAKARAAMVPKAEFAALTDGLHCHCGFDLGKRIDLSAVRRLKIIQHRTEDKVKERCPGQIFHRYISPHLRLDLPDSLLIIRVFFIFGEGVFQSYQILCPFVAFFGVFEHLLETQAVIVYVFHNRKVYRVVFSAKYFHREQSIGAWMIFPSRMRCSTSSS